MTDNKELTKTEKIIKFINKIQDIINPMHEITLSFRFKDNKDAYSFRNSVDTLLEKHDSYILDHSSINANGYGFLISFTNDSQGTMLSIIKKGNYIIFNLNFLSSKFDNKHNYKLFLKDTNYLFQTLNGSYKLRCGSKFSNWTNNPNDLWNDLKKNF